MKKMHSILTVILSFALALGLCPVHSFAEDAAVKSWKDLYSELGVTASAEEGYYDAVSSATSFSSRHAGDIPDVVHRVTDADGKTTALDGVVLPGAQVNVTPALGSTDYTDSSSYGTDELVIYPDDTVEGYVWNNYLKAMYAVTVSDGTTTVGALPWIDFYGEQSTSGFHYNKIQVALNSGTSVEAVADLITLAGEEVDFSQPYQFVDPEKPWKKRKFENCTIRKLQKPVILGGKRCEPPVPTMDIAAYVKRQMRREVWEEEQRFENPHRHYLDFSPAYYQMKMKMLGEPAKE